MPSYETAKVEEIYIGNKKSDSAVRGQGITVTLDREIDISRGSVITKDNKLDITQTKLTPESLAEMIKLIEDGTISNKIAKEIIIELLEKGGNPKEIVDKKGLSVINDENELVAIVEKIINDNPSQVAAYRGGKDKLFGFFVGQVMKATQGRANPQIINEVLHKKLG